MAENQIPISYVVTASIIPPSAGLEPLKLSTILLLTDDAPITPLEDDYMIARNATSVNNAFGTTSETAAQTQVIYSQSPNILANQGYVIIAPYKLITTSATAGTLTTPAITIDSFKSVSDGLLNIIIDGTATEIKNLDFSNIETLEDIADIISAKVTNATITVNGETLVFTSNTIGINSKIAIATATGSGTDLYNTDYLNGVACVAVDGTASTTRKETYTEAINRMAGNIYFEGILTTRAVTDSEAIAASNLVQSMTDRVLMLPASSFTALTSETGLFDKVKSNTKTKCLLYTLGDTETEKSRNARLYAAAYLSRGLAVNWSGSNTTMTMNLKDLTGISADININETILDKCSKLGVDCYVSLEGLAKVISNKNTLYFDQIVNQIWLLTTIQRTVFNVLATTRTKIPQTTVGMNQLVNACRQVCDMAINNGMAAPGSWNSTDTFGNYDDFHRNIEELGFYIYYQPIAEQLQAEREQRIAPTIQIAVKEAGAIHSANILIYVEP